MKSKLIIFDLDDTLIETSKCFLPKELRNALQAMVDEGLEVGDFEEAFERLMELNRVSLSGNEALGKFVGEENKKYLNIAIESYNRCNSLNFDMEVVPHALEVLDELKDNTLALLSKGIEHVQMLKIEKANIDPTMFSKIMITRDYNKGEAYKIIMGELGFSAEDVIVVGDKVKGDLLPGRELGVTTVFMKHGIRAHQFPAKEGEVDFTITDLKELIPIIEKLQ